MFWKVGSSATLGAGSVLAGNILALTSISVSDGVTLHGRALARNGAVTLIDDTITAAHCAVGAVGSAPAARAERRRRADGRARASAPTSTCGRTSTSRWRLVRARIDPTRANWTKGTWTKGTWTKGSWSKGTWSKGTLDARTPQPERLRHERKLNRSTGVVAERPDRAQRPPRCTSAGSGTSIRSSARTSSWWWALGIMRVRHRALAGRAGVPAQLVFVLADRHPADARADLHQRHARLRRRDGRRRSSRCCCVEGPPSSSPSTSRSSRS